MPQNNFQIRNTRQILDNPSSDNPRVVFFPNNHGTLDKNVCHDSDASKGQSGFNTFAFLSFALTIFNAMSVIVSNINNRNNNNNDNSNDNNNNQFSTMEANTMIKQEVTKKKRKRRSAFSFFNPTRQENFPPLENSKDEIAIGYSKYSNNGTSETLDTNEMMQSHTLWQHPYSKLLHDKDLVDSLNVVSTCFHAWTKINILLWSLRTFKEEKYDNLFEKENLIKGNKFSIYDRDTDNSKTRHDSDLRKSCVARAICSFNKDVSNNFKNPIGNVLAEVLSYKIIAEYSGLSVEELSFYIDAIFNGQSAETNRRNANESGFWFLMKTELRHHTRKSFNEYQCNERYPCPKEVWHITEVLWKILTLPTSWFLKK